jgi:hypothetical protein
MRVTGSEQEIERLAWREHNGASIPMYERERDYFKITRRMVLVTLSPALRIRALAK